MEFRLLGPLEVVRDGRDVPLGGPRQASLLALLLLHANEVVSRDRLIDELWRDRDPAGATHGLDVQVSRLRKALEPDEVVHTRTGGYVLEVEPSELDGNRFERLLEEGRRANAAGEPARALEVLDAALALWRGAALADFAYEDFARAEAGRLEALRLVAIEERIDAELALGRHDTAVPELEALTARYPLRERLHGQRMLALYRAGRQAEALRSYADARTRLVEELGIEPGPALRAREQAVLRQDPALDLPLTSGAAPRRRRRALAGAGALALAGLATAAVLVVARGGTELASGHVDPNSDVFLDAGSGALVRQVGVRDTVDLHFGANALWSVSADGELTRLDPASGKIVATLGLGVRPGGLAVGGSGGSGGGSVWVTDATSPTLFRIDPVVNEVVDRFPLPRAGLGTIFTGDVAVGAGSVWVGHGGYNPGAWVERLDPETGRLQHRFPILGGDADHLAFADGVLWVGSTASGQVRRIDPAADSATRVAALRGQMCCLAAGGGYVWAAMNPDHLVWKLDTRGTPVRSFKLAGAIKGVTYAAGALWAAVGEAGTVVRIDPTTNAARSYAVGHDVTDVDVRDGIVAAGIRQSAADATAGLTGKVVWIGRKAETLFDGGSTTDPAFTAPTWDAPQLAFHYATCARLLNYPDAGGDAGRRLVPEVAAGFPAVTDGGRTYTFRIREGFRFSPPSGEAVTAASFRRALERILSPRLDPFASPLPPGLANIVGAGAYHAGAADHVAGLAVRGDELVIRLRSPAPDLPWLAALVCAVPAPTPVVPLGLDAPVPSAGPYYLAAHTDSVAVLRPNPYYHGPRPRHLDAIVFRFGVAPDDAAVEIADGKLDYFLESQNATLTPETAAARAAGSRYRLTPSSSPSTRFLAFNPARPLFADLRMRRAVQLALDRAALAAVDGGLPATRLGSPKTPGFDPAPLYSLRPDLRAARRLAGGRKARAVFLTFDPAADPAAAAFARAVREQLAAIGIRLTLLPLTNADFEHGGAGAARKTARSDLSWGGVNAHTADPVEYLEQLTLPARDRAALERIAALPSPSRETQAAQLARRIERESLFAVYDYSALPELVSARLGCIVHQPEYAGVDLAALCLRSAG